MNINGVNGASPIRPIQSQPTPRTTEKASSEQGSDMVEISHAARFASKLAEIAPVRADLVQRVRNEIQAGTYETPEKMQAALSKLFEDLDF